MPETKPDCPVCGSTGAARDGMAIRAINVAPPFGVVRCGSCGMRWLNPRPTEDEYRRLYEAVYFDGGGDVPDWAAEYPPPPDETRRYHGDTVGTRLDHQRAQLADIAAVKPGRGRLLEVGAGHGEFLDLARREGWDVEGIEPSHAARLAAKERFDLDLADATLDHYEASEPFDVVYMSHVLEHLPEPRRSLDDVRRLLLPDGLLVVEVPNQFDSWLRRISRVARRWQPGPRNMYSIHHALFFAPRQLERLLWDCGFEAEITTHFPVLYRDGLRRRLMSAVNLVADRLAREGDVIQAFATIAR